MNSWDKFTSDPDGLGVRGSPFVRVLVGLGFIGLDIEAIWTGDIKLGKHDNSEHLLFSSSPFAFIVACAVLALMAAWALSSARDRYLMHGKSDA